MRSDAKIIVPIIAAATVISLAVILVLIPLFTGTKACSEAKAFGAEWIFCPEQAPTPKETTAPTAGQTGEVSPPPDLPEDETTVTQSYEETSAQDQIQLNSIAGNWNIAGGTHNGLSNFFGTITFGVNNQFSTLLNLNGYLQPIQYGTYSYSASDSTLTLTYFGQGPNYYTVKDTTGNSFNIVGPFDTVSFVRI